MRSYRFRIGALTTAGALLVGLPMCARDASQQTVTSSSASPGFQIAPAAVAGDAATAAILAKAPLGEVVSRDPSGAARFIVGITDRSQPAINETAETAARLHLARHAGVLGLSMAVVRDARVSAVHPLPGGASIVQLEQRVNGLEVFRARASVVVDASKHLVSIATSLQPSALQGSKSMTFATPAESALAKAYVAKTGVALAAASVRDDGARSDAWRGYQMTTPKGAPRILQANAKQVIFPESRKLVPAYHVEILARAEGSTENQAHAYVIAADDGRTLYESSLTANDAFNYRVWAATDGNHIPTDGPLVDYSPHPTGVADKIYPGYVAPVLVSMEGFNKNPQGAADPWLASAATTTLGNNVTAYSDRNDYTDDAGVLHLDGFDPGDVRADVTSAQTFDRVYDVTKQPNDTTDQIKAAVTQIFYTTNWLHDYWYDSGFNEASGVAQTDNFGRGGIGNDPLRAEAQDGADTGSSNNANMSAFSDGTSPRMQMYVWSGMPNRHLAATPAIAFTDSLGAALFGAQTFDLTGDAVLSDDGSATPSTSDACQAPTNVAGKIAVIDRGTCNFTVKAENAQNAGAIGILMINNAAGHAAVSPGVADPVVTIPLIGVSLEDGTLLKAALASGSVSLHLTRGTEALHDGTIDNTVVGHEWGHYLHHRLVQCGSASCGGMSEGWADIDALMLVIKDGDPMVGSVFPLAQYAAGGLGDNGAYFGIRRAPYSTDMAKFPFTFQHVRQAGTAPTTAPLAAAAANLNEVHNVGEIWAEMFFEGYVNMLTAAKNAAPSRTFDQTKRRLADYIVAGMKATPTEPTFTEQRDAVLSTVWAMGRPEDFAALATGFAKRGLGVGAVAPPTTSKTLNEAVENFDYKGNLAYVDAAVDDSVLSCDHDGILDAGEKGLLTVRVRNVGWLPLTKTQVTVTSTNTSITFANGGVASVASIDPYGVATVTIGISADASATPSSVLPIAITVADPDSYKTSVSGAFQTLFDYDDVPATSATDNVESPSPVWTFGHGTTPFDAWTRTGDTTNHVWNGADLGFPSDESLVSPDLVVSATDAFTIAFTHRYGFEHSKLANVDTFYDGGVIELSVDGGTTWDDISKYVDPTYPQTVYTSTSGPSTNVLAGRKAFAGDSAGYPTLIPVTLGLGTQLAGKTVKVRFRVGSDDASGGTGWDIDQIAFGGITNKPFSTQTGETTICDEGTADAGVDANDGSTSTGDVDAGVDAAMDTGLPGLPDADVDADLPIDASLPDANDSGPVDAGSDTGIVDAGSDSGQDSGNVDSGSDAGHDSGTDSGSDAGHDGGVTDGGTDSGSDAGTDSGSDAGHDGGVTDAGHDGGDSGAGTDSGTDAGHDAGVIDAGSDAGHHDGGTNPGGNDDGGTTDGGSHATDGGHATQDGGDAGGDGGDTISGGGDDGCSCSTSVGHSNGGTSSGAAGGLGLMGGLVVLMRRRRRAAR